MKARRWAAVAVLLVAACQHHKPIQHGPGAVTQRTTPAFEAQPFQPSIWPFPTKQSVAAWRAHPASIPWATDRLKVLQHYVTDVLKIPGVEVRPHYGAGSDFDLVAGGRHISQVSMQEEADRLPVAWSVSYALGRFLGENVPQTGGAPFVVSGYARRHLPVHLRLMTTEGRLISTGTTMPVGPTFLTSLPSPTTGTVVVEADTRDEHGLDSLEFSFTDLEAQPTATTTCGSTRLAIQSPRAMAYGYVGGRTLGFTIANTGSAPCTLDGYLRLSVHDGRGRLPFIIRHGSSPFWHDPGARRVVLRPGDVAVVAIDKQHCDLGADRKGTTLRLGLPGVGTVTLAGEVDYCKPANAEDDGNVLTMTAVAGSMTAIYRPPP